MEPNIGDKFAGPIKVEVGRSCWGKWQRKHPGKHKRWTTMSLVRQSIQME